ncbi:MAG: hypothetical protein WAT66_12850, partial [Actinomycetota bacterium]
MERRYWSARAGRSGVSHIDLAQALRLFAATFSSLSARGFFQESMGYTCVDAGDVDGTMGSDIGAFFLRKLRKDHLWPIWDKTSAYDLDDLFDVIELLNDHVSEPMEGFGSYHGFNNCGWHYSRFDRQAGRKVFRDEINEIMRDLDEGYELSDEGEVRLTGGAELAALMETPLAVSADPDDVAARVEAAVRKYRSRSATVDDRRDAVRDLGDVLEFLRPQVKA